MQGRILKHAGDPEGAAAVACRAESMDLADRYAHVPACLTSISCDRHSFACQSHRVFQLFAIVVVVNTRDCCM